MEWVGQQGVSLKPLHSPPRAGPGSGKLATTMPNPDFNPRVAALAVPPIPAIRAWAQAYDGRQGPLIDLSQAAPGYPPHPRLLAALAEAAGSAELAGYGPIEGDGLLRAACAQAHNSLYLSDLEAADVHITAGCNQAFAAAVLALVAPGHSVALLSPCYFNHRTTLAMLGVCCKLVACRAERGFVPDLADIDAALDGRVGALVLVTPNNPTGAIYPPALMRAVAALCRERGVWLLLDETYRDFLPDAGVPPHGLFADTTWRSRVVGLYSYSKSFCIPGHRLGALMGGPAVIGQVAKVMDNLQICAPRPAQQAVARCLKGLADWRESNRQEILRRAAAFRDALAAAAGWQLEAIGAYFAYVRHPMAGLGAEGVAQRLALEAGVLTVPGSCFGPGQERHLRMAFANADLQTLGQLPGRLRRLAA